MDKSTKIVIMIQILCILIILICLPSVIQHKNYYTIATAFIPIICGTIFLFKRYNEKNDE